MTIEILLKKEEKKIKVKRRVLLMFTLRIMIPFRRTIKITIHFQYTHIYLFIRSNKSQQRFYINKTNIHVDIYY